MDNSIVKELNGLMEGMTMKLAYIEFQIQNLV
jgi:hypothetical protein